MILELLSITYGQMEMYLALGYGGVPWVLSPGSIPGFFALSRILDAMSFLFLETGRVFLFVLRILTEAITLLFHALFVAMETKKSYFEVLLYNIMCLKSNQCIWPYANILYLRI